MAFRANPTTGTMKESPFARFEEALAADAPKSRKGRSCYVAVTVPPDLKETLTALAKADNRTLAGYCRRVLSLHVKGIPTNGKVLPFPTCQAKQ